MQPFAELNREQLRALAPDTLVVLPIGATEQHGPHLATGTDFFAIQAIATASAKIAGTQIPILVAPTLPFGSSDHHLIFGGTLSLSTETYYRVLRELLESLVTSGFRQIFLLNGHGGNHELAELAARDVVGHRDAAIGAASYWALAWDALAAAGACDSRRLPGHAGDFETSLMLALRPDLTPGPLPRRDRPESSDPLQRVAPYRAERAGWWREVNGFTDSPAQATAENGHRWLALIAREVARSLIEFYRPPK